MTLPVTKGAETKFTIDIDGRQVEFVGCEIGRGSNGVAFFVEPENKHVIKAFLGDAPTARVNRDHELKMMQLVRGKWTPEAAGIEATPVGPAILMRRYEGSLQAHVMANGTLTPEEGAGVYARLLLAVRDAADQHGVAHCDIKPDNILVTTTKGRLDITLADWGGAKLVGETRTCVTPIYAPLESLVTERRMVDHHNPDGSIDQISKDIRCFGGPADAKGDVYSAAASIISIVDTRGPQLGMFPFPGAILHEWTHADGTTGNRHLDIALLHAADKDHAKRSSPTDALLDIACIREAREFIAQEPAVVNEITERYLERGEHLRTPAHEAAIGFGLMRLLPENDPRRPQVKAKQDSCERAAAELTAVRAQLARNQQLDRESKTTSKDATTTKQPKLPGPQNLAERHQRDKELHQAIRANLRTQTNDQPSRGQSR